MIAHKKQEEHKRIELQKQQEHKRIERQKQEESKTELFTDLVENLKHCKAQHEAFVIDHL